MTDRSPPLFSVVICTRNEADHIARCLDSLLNGTYPLDRLDILVCDGRSTDATRSIVQRIADESACVRLLDNPRRTAPFGFNLGIAAAKGDVVAILGAHAEVAPDWAAANVAALEAHPEADGVGGRMTTVAEGYVGRAIAAATASPFGVGNSSFRVGGRPGWADTVVFGAYRRETFEKVGTFDEELARNQDDEFNYRINSRGGKLWFDPAIRTTYYARTSLTNVYRQYAQYGLWKPLVYRKCPGVFGVRQLVPPLFVLSLVACSVAGLAWRPAWAVLGVIGALYGAGAVLFAVRACVGCGLRHVFLVPVVYVLVHVAYGLHFLLGLVRLAVCRRPPAGRHTSLTR